LTCAPAAPKTGIVRPSPSSVARRALALALALALAPLACRGSGGDAAPPCGAVAARFLEIARYDLARAKLDDVTARAVTDQLPAMRDALAAACSDGAWGAEPRKCLVAAVDHVGFEACEQHLSDDQRRDLDRATRAPRETP
jgi:hypothetical protein